MLLLKPMIHKEIDMTRQLKAAVLLAGCGHMDGAEIREAVLTLLALDQHGITTHCMALDINQHHVVDHSSGAVVTSCSRNMFKEASRIARSGQCHDLAKAKAQDYDMLLLPGGFGVAKNFCDFAFKGADGTVLPEISNFIQGFFEAKKPVGAICISPALVAMVLHQMGKSAQLTLGNGKEIAGAMEKLNQKCKNVQSARDVMVDEDLKLVTTAAYMFDNASLSDVWVGIERCVAETVRRA